MIKIIKQNGAYLLLFALLFFSSTILAQDNESGGGDFNWDGMNELDDVSVGGDRGGSDDSWDSASLYWDNGWNNYSSPNDDYDDYFENNNSNNSSENSQPNDTPNERNIIDKPVITKQELGKLIQDLIGRYTVTTKTYVLTTVDGVPHTGTIVKFEDRTTGHTFYYFTPDTTDGILKMDNYYKIPEPTGTSSTNTNSNINFTIPGYLDGDRMPIGFQIMETLDGDKPVFLNENDQYPKSYCQDCTQIVPVTNPKYPTLLKLLPKIRELIFKNPKIWASLSVASGSSLQEIDHYLSVDNMKNFVRVADINTFGLFERKITPNFVFIRENLIESLETGGYKVGGYNENLYDTSFFVALTILHEFVHYARFWNRLPVDFTRNGKQYEAGEVFESDIFGHVLTLNQVTNYAKQYGWTF